MILFMIIKNFELTIKIFNLIINKINKFKNNLIPKIIIFYIINNYFIFEKLFYFVL